MDFQNLHSFFGQFFSGTDAGMTPDELHQCLDSADIDSSNFSDHQFQDLLTAGDGHAPLAMDHHGVRFGAGTCYSCGGSGTWWTPGSGTRACPNCGGSGVG